MENKLPFNPPQLTNYSDSSWIESYFSQEEVRQLVKIYDEREKDEAQVSDDGKLDLDLRKSTVAFLQPAEEDHQHLIYKLAQLAMQVNQERYNFDLMGFYEPIQIAQYAQGDFFDWHSDFSTGSASTRKLSLSVQLSDPSEYEGGDLQFMINTKQVNAPKTLGTVIIFPSFVLHRVTPITSGVRKSLVGWVSGVPFR